MSIAKKMLQRVQGLPNSLAVALTVFALLPLWSLTFVHPVDVLTAKDGLGSALMTAATYWVIPVVIAAAILARSFLFLAAFAAECLLLVLVSLRQTTGDQLLVARLVLLGIASATGLLLARKDILFPFMAAGSRFWRHTPRTVANCDATLRRDSGDGLRCMIEDYSLTGMAVALAKRENGAVRAHDKLDLCLVHAGTSIVVPMRVAWCRDIGELTKVGLASLSPPAMERALLAINGRQASRGAWASRLERWWVASALRRGALALFGVSLAFSFGMPACGVIAERPKHTDHRAGSASAVGSHIDPTAAVSSPSSDTGPWRQLRAVSQDGGTLTFELSDNEDAGLEVDLSAFASNAAMLIPRGAVKGTGSLTVSPGGDLAADFWKGQATSAPTVRQRLMSITFSAHGLTSQAVPVTLRLPLVASGTDAGLTVDPAKVAVLYHVKRAGKDVDGMIEPSALRLVPAGAQLGLTDSQANVAETQLDTDLDGSAQGVELENNGGSSDGANDSGQSPPSTDGGTGSDTTTGGTDSGTTTGGTGSGTTTGSTDSDDFSTFVDPSFDNEFPPADESAPPEGSSSASASGTCPVPCKPAVHYRCNGKMIEAQACTLVNGAEQWTKWSPNRDCSDTSWGSPSNNSSNAVGQCVVMISGTTQFCAPSSLSPDPSSTCEIAAPGHSSKACP